MPSDVQKLALSRQLERFAGEKWAAAQQLLGRSLPASVISVISSGIVKVKFELDPQNVLFTLPQITVPIFGSEYVRLPIQAGMKGWVVPSDVYLGGVSGLGGGTADLSPRPNMANLVFSPIGNTAWDAPVDANAACIYGPDGAILYSADKTAMLKVTKTENSWLAPIAAPATIKGPLVVQGDLRISGNIVAEDGTTYTGNIATTGEVTAKFGAGHVGLSTHQHAQQNDSHGDTEEPTDAPTGGT